jgi:cytochrome P450
MPTRCTEILCIAEGSAIGARCRRGGLEFADVTGREWRVSAEITIDIPVTEIDPFSEEFRGAGPVFKLKKYGICGMARYAQVQAALNDWQTFISGAGAGIQNLRRGKAWRPPSIVLEVDRPLHDQTRGVMGRVLSGPAVRKSREKFELEAERLVEDLVSRGTFDAVADLATAYPLKVMGDAVGVPTEGRECLLPFSNMLFNSFGPENEIAFQQSRPAAARPRRRRPHHRWPGRGAGPTGCHGSRTHRGEGGREGHRRLFSADQGVDPM